MPKKLVPVRPQLSQSTLVESYPPQLFQPPPGGWKEHFIRLQAERGVPESIFRGFSGPYNETQQTELLKLAQQVDDCDTFLALAKEAWIHMHWRDGGATRINKKRGRTSVEEQCYAAIKAGHDELGLPTAEFWRDGEEPTYIYRNDNYQRLPLGRLE